LRSQEIFEGLKDAETGREGDSEHRPIQGNGIELGGSS
jgi:hypothetical protein